VKIPSTMLASFHEAPPEPTAGQIWRAAWDEVVELVTITNVAGTEMTVVPITFEARYADSQAYVLPAEATSLGVSVAAWAGMERLLPVRVLHRCLGAVSGEMTPSWPQSVPGSRQGRRIVTPVDPRAEHRAEIEDHLDLLAEADWAPAGSGALAQWLEAASIGVATLGEATGCSPAQGLALRRGQAVVTETEAEALAPLLGRSVADILAANPPVPKPLRARLDRPAWRAFVQRLAALRDLPERLAWQAAAYGTLRMAGRVTAADDEAIWDKRLERYFQATLDL
jgi:hypothetical protein